MNSSISSNSKGQSFNLLLNCPSAKLVWLVLISLSNASPATRTSLSPRSDGKGQADRCTYVFVIELDAAVTDGREIERNRRDSRSCWTEGATVFSCCTHWQWGIVGIATDRELDSERSESSHCNESIEESTKNEGAGYLKRAMSTFRRRTLAMATKIIARTKAVWEKKSVPTRTRVSPSNSERKENTYGWDRPGRRSSKRHNSSLLEAFALIRFDWRREPWWHWVTFHHHYKSNSLGNRKKLMTTRWSRSRREISEWNRRRIEDLSSIGCRGEIRSEEKN